MLKILKRVSDYTIEDLRNYCKNNGLDFEIYKYYYMEWAIEAHEYDLNRFIYLAGNDKPVTVSGVVFLDNKHYRVKPKTLPLKKAFDAMLTTDAQDFSISLNLNGKYYVYVLHGRGHNVFKFALNDENGKTTTSN